jgi:hypothetical protein
MASITKRAKIENPMKKADQNTETAYVSKE